MLLRTMQTLKQCDSFWPQERYRTCGMGSQDPENAIVDMSVVHPRNATRLVRQHRLDGGPFIIREF
jgi:hypothetical protein